MGIGITLGIIAVWFYLFTFGTPKSADDVFTRFGIEGEQGITPTTSDGTRIDVDSNLETGAREKLRQLTLRPVAGAIFTETGTEYVEQGTGHIYSINMTSGEETLISGTTIPQTTRALFSKDAAYVAITSQEPEGESVVVGSVVTTEDVGGTTEGVTLPKGAREIAFSDTPHVVTYLIDTETGASGYAYNLLKKTSTTLFTIPLRDVRVLWGTSTYVYTIPTATQDGHLYEVIKNELTYTTEEGLGLMGFRFGTGVIVTKKVAETVSSIARLHTGEEREQSLRFIPEKCTAHPTQKETAYCAVPSNYAREVFPDDWYKGVLSYADILWSVDLTTGTSKVLSNFTFESGRDIDVTQIGTNAEGTLIWFINKNDNTLWMFDTTL